MPDIHASLPIVVQLGFGGSRRLFEIESGAKTEAIEFERAIETYLEERVKRLPGELGLLSNHFICGISQVAIGADTLFTNVCRRLEISQRIFLPQPAGEYLNASGSDSIPDFSAQQRVRATQLLESEHVIDTQVVSVASDRQSRFEEVNMEIARVSDLVFCLICEDAVGKRGGTDHLLQCAGTRHKPALEIRIGSGIDGPTFRESWHNLERFRVPALPSEMSELRAVPWQFPLKLPEIGEYCQRLKSWASRKAKTQSRHFKMAALIIVATHFSATICAVTAVTLGENASIVVTCFLVAELLFLIVGLSTHIRLHTLGDSRQWALARLVAEVIRSVISIGPTHAYLNYYFTLPFPQVLRPLLRTINVLHLRSTRRVPGRNWQLNRDRYVDERLVSDKSGQLQYYRSKLPSENSWLRRAHGTFLVCSGAAFLFTLSKLVNHILVNHVTDDAWHLGKILGAFAIVLPLVAVAALSLAAAHDLEARVHTYKEAIEFLEAQTDFIKNAKSETEFARLLLETESRLLGETVSWFSRRAFIGVS